MMTSDTKLHVCFKQDGITSSLNDKPLKLVNNSHTSIPTSHLPESNVNVHIAKAWIAIYRLRIIW